MTSQLTWSEWLAKAKSGQAWSVYMLLYQLVFLFVLALKMVLMALIGGYIIATILMLLAAFILSDLVAHTFWNGWKSDLSLKEFLTAKLFKRTHDIDGEIAMFGLAGVIVWFTPHWLFYINGGITLLGVLTGAMGLTALIVIADLIYKRFYH